MTMVERVARAICDGTWDARTIHETPSGETPEEHRLYWMEKARAAIAAMREPTDAMVEAAMRGRDGTIPAAVVRSLWATAIDAALAEDEG